MYTMADRLCSVGAATSGGFVAFEAVLKLSSVRMVIRKR